MLVDDDDICRRRIWTPVAHDLPFFEERKGKASDGRYGHPCRRVCAEQPGRLPVLRGPNWPERQGWKGFAELCVS